MSSLFLDCFLGLCLLVPLHDAKTATFLEKHPNVSIIGGKQAQDGQFPWQVAVFVYKTDASFCCGGALINLKWVLTGARCVDGAQSFSLRLGSNSLSNTDHHRVVLDSVYSVAHPEYNPLTLEHDVGLIRIDTPIQTTAYIQVIPLGNTILSSDLEVTVSGWGSIASGGGISYDLNYVDLTSISNTECRSKTGETIPDETLCAVAKVGQGICTGDSGSPLVARDGGGNTVHVGVASWISASGCDTRLVPTKYARTDSYREWIDDVINNN